MTQAVKSAKTQGSRKNRRSKRLPAAHRMLLTIIGPSGSEIAKEIVSTVEISQYGARVRGRRILRSDSEGLLTQLSSGRQARMRVAWQRPTDAQPGLLDAGVEFLNGFDYWGISFVDSPPALDPPEARQGADADAFTPQELIEALAGEAAERPQVLEAVWSALVEQLEVREMLRRADLVAAIRSLAPESPPRENPPESRPESRKEKK